MPANTRDRKNRQRERHRADREMTQMKIDEGLLVETHTDSNADDVLPPGIMQMCTASNILRQRYNIESLQDVESMRKMALNLRTDLHDSQKSRQELVRVKCKNCSKTFVSACTKLNVLQVWIICRFCYTHNRNMNTASAEIYTIS